MDNPEYPRKGHAFDWVRKSDWGPFMTTGSITCAIITATLLAAPQFQGGVPAQRLPQDIGHPWYFWSFLICGIIYLVGAWATVLRDSNRRKYDTNLAIKYTDIFFEDNEPERKAANKVLIDFHTGTNEWKGFPHACEIEPVLDVLDDIGFLFDGDQISDRVVYQYFSFWIKLYYESSKGYIEMKRADDSSVWEHLPALYEAMMKIDAHKNRKTPQSLVSNRERLLEMLRDENAMYKPPSNAPQKR